jgi:hypothetical protein
MFAGTTLDEMFAKAVTDLHNVSTLFSDSSE